MAGVSSAENMVLIGQVRNAKANHCVELATKLLRNKNFPGDRKIVYLGDVASSLLNQMESPETPEFLELPGYNEQKWKLKTTSGPLEITILSDSYWGFGLFNSGYLNIIEMNGPRHIISRLIFDLAASSAGHPWQFKHMNSATKYLRKKIMHINLKTNEANWKELISECKENYNETIHMMSGAIEKIETKVNSAGEINGWSKDKAKVSIASAKFDLNIAIEALADSNVPSVERAIARIEANLIEADPENAMNDEDSEYTIEKSLETIGFDEDLVIKSIDDETIPLIDLTSSEE